MKRILFLAALSLGLWLSPAMVAPVMAQKRVALVIGNDNYTNVSPLRKAANDADRMAQTLKGLGFQVIAATNQNRRSMSDRITAFERALGPGDTAFFFFAGHGFQIKGENYLLPIDVPMALDGEEEKVHENSFLARRIMERIKNKGVRTTVVVRVFIRCPSRGWSCWSGRPARWAGRQAGPPPRTRPVP